MPRTSHPPAPPRYMRITEVAHELGLDRTTIYDKIHNGQLVAVNVANKGSELRVTRASFDAYCARIEAEATRRFDIPA